MFFLDEISPPSLTLLPRGISVQWLIKSNKKRQQTICKFIDLGWKLFFVYQSGKMENKTGQEQFYDLSLQVFC